MPIMAVQGDLCKFPPIAKKQRCTVGNSVELLESQEVEGKDKNLMACFMGIYT